MHLLSLEVAELPQYCVRHGWSLARELTVICGNNGQGKTNLLEAIWLLTGGKSFRGGKDAELVRRGEAFAVLEAVTQRDPAGGSVSRTSRPTCAHDGGHAGCHNARAGMRR
ncbi:MAG: AAA family ATPase [Faecalibacterium prausnitzii]